MLGLPGGGYVASYLTLCVCVPLAVRKKDISSSWGTRQSHDDIMLRSRECTMSWQELKSSQCGDTTSLGSSCGAEPMSPHISLP